MQVLWLLCSYVCKFALNLTAESLHLVLCASHFLNDTSEGKIRLLACKYECLNVHIQCCVPMAKMVPGEQRLNRLTSGPLFPGPGSEGGGQCVGPVLSVWELSVGAECLWSATNASITSRLSANDCSSLVFKLNTLFAVKQTSECLQNEWSSFLVAVCPIYVPPTYWLLP